MELQFTNALVTGGAGFIGSHLVDALVAAGCRVTVLDNLSTGHRRNIAHVADRIEFIHGDIRDAVQVAQATEGAEVVFHQAAVVSVALSVEDPPHACEVNDLGTVRVLDAARRAGVRRVIMASSSAVYGNDPRLPKSETMATNPLSPYAVQKLAGEHYAAVFASLYGLETVCLRYFNVFGPRQDPSSPYSGVISIFMRCATGGSPPTIHGDGEQTRDFIFVSDVVHANLLAANHGDAKETVYNVGSGASIRVRDLWDMIGELAHRRYDPVFGAPRPGDVRDSLADIRRIQRSLGFRPQHAMRQGLEQTLAWYRSCG